MADDALIHQVALAMAARANIPARLAPLIPGLKARTSQPNVSEISRHIPAKDLRGLLSLISGCAAFDIGGIDRNRLDLDQQIMPARRGFFYVQVDQALFIFDGGITIEANSFHKCAFLSSRCSFLTKILSHSSSLLFYHI